MLRMFGYLSPVAPRGGGTLIIAGSHRLAEPHLGKSSKDLRAALADTSPWFHDLWRPKAGEDRIDRYMIQDAVVDGVPVRVVELVGEPGDIVLWHPSLLHTIARNALDQPRFMLTHTVVRAAA
jgi:ectoine hydroxylase-related dioxygenase (phytanoyl-CoA dioxygenase family)